MSLPFQGALPPPSQSSDLPETWVLLGCVVLASCLVVSLERQHGSGDSGPPWTQRWWRFPEGGRRCHCVLTVCGQEGALLAGVPAPACPSGLSLLRVLWALLSPLCPLLATGSTVQETRCPGEGLGWGNQREPKGTKPPSSPGARSALCTSVDTARWRPHTAVSGPTFLFSHLSESGDRHLVEPRRKYILKTFFLFT